MAEGKSAVLGEPVVDVSAEWLFPDQHVGETPLEEPGLILVHNGANSHIFARRHNIFRPSEHDDPTTYETDLLAVSGTALAVLGLHGKSTPIAFNGTRPTGVEVEVGVYDKEGNPSNLWTPDGVHILGEDYPPELWNNTLEIAGDVGLTAEEAYKSALSELSKAQKLLLTHGYFIDPASARMNDRPGREDTTPHLYVQAMCDMLGDMILKFPGNGIHRHNELHLELLPQIMSRFRVVAPYLNVGLLAAPFMNGELVPNLADEFNDSSLRQFDKIQPQSVRYITRSRASKNGGVGRLSAPEDLETFLREGDVLIAEGEIKSPERALGQHADVRGRVDPPSLNTPDHIGRMEVCVSDTGALRLPTLVAYAVLERSIIAKLEQVALEGNEGFTRLHNNHPELFGSSASLVKQLEYAHSNSDQMAYFGAEAQVVDGVGKTVSVREQMKKLLDFAGIKPEFRQVIADSLLRQSAVIRAASRYKDSDGLPSLEGYYRTGVGTPAMWMILRARAEQDRLAFPEVHESAIMSSGLIDRTTACAKYLAGLNL